MRAVKKIHRGSEILWISDRDPDDRIITICSGVYVDHDARNRIELKFVTVRPPDFSYKFAGRQFYEFGALCAVSLKPDELELKDGNSSFALATDSELEEYAFPGEKCYIHFNVVESVGGIVSTRRASGRLHGALHENLLYVLPDRHLTAGELIAGTPITLKKDNGEIILIAVGVGIKRVHVDGGEIPYVVACPSTALPRLPIFTPKKINSSYFKNPIQHAAIPSDMRSSDKNKRHWISTDNDWPAVKPRRAAEAEAF